MLASEPKLKRRNGVETRSVPQGALLVDMSSGRCFRLNRVGAFIWEMLATPRDIEEICRDIASHYQMPIEAIDGEIRQVVDQLARECLIDDQSTGLP
jgi:coenzyme PQQ synthesis protein D (PqqD)